MSSVSQELLAELDESFGEPSHKGWWENRDRLINVSWEKTQSGGAVETSVNLPVLMEIIKAEVRSFLVEDEGVRIFPVINLWDGPLISLRLFTLNGNDPLIRTVSDDELFGPFMEIASDANALADRLEEKAQAIREMAKELPPE